MVCKHEKLAEPAIEAAKKGDLLHVPDRFEKIYLHWLEEIETGVFPDSCGGGIESLLTTVKNAMRLLLQGLLQKNALSAIV